MFQNMVYNMFYRLTSAGITTRTTAAFIKEEIEYNIIKTNTVRFLYVVYGCFGSTLCLNSG